MLREYEVTLITNAQLSEDDSKNLYNKYESILCAEGGQVIRKNEWGVRKLAFPMKQHFRGQYTHYDLTAKPEQLAEAERLMRIDDNILRYLSIRIGEDVDVEQRKTELAKAEAEAQAARQREEQEIRNKR
ncbi:MAG: 30S ribosomal protein S6 [Deltaproteobacteria bacterium]|nr:30S ribosomal protein S6 [Deltaproteobacteria bacterium]